jgi:hypothetical protein
VEIKPDDLNVLHAALALSLIDIPGVAHMAPKEALKRVQLSADPQGELLVNINIDMSADADLNTVKRRIDDFVKRLFTSYFESEVKYDIVLEIENVKE